MKYRIVKRQERSEDLAPYREWYIVERYVFRSDRLPFRYEWLQFRDDFPESEFLTIEDTEKAIMNMKIPLNDREVVKEIEL